MTITTIKTKDPMKWELWRMEINPFKRIESIENYKPMTKQEINDYEAENEGKYYDYGEDLAL